MKIKNYIAISLAKGSDKIKKSNFTKIRKINNQTIKYNLLMKSFFVFLLLLIFPIITFSQTSSTTYPLNGYTPTSTATGSPLGSYSISDIENINLFSGSLNVTLPLMRVGGRGSAGYTISLPIEHRWRIQDAYYPSGGPWSGGPPPPEAWQHHYYPQYGNWTEGAGFGPGIMRSRRNSTFQGVCPYTPNSPIWGGQVLTQMTFIGPGGTEMNFFDRRTGGTPTVYTPDLGCNITPDGANRGNVWVTGDGSNVVFITSGNFTESPGSNAWDIGAPSGDMYFPDGTHYKIVQGSVTYINDRNGNKISFTYSLGKVATITDSLNRTLTNVSSGTITYYGVGGASRTIEIGSDNLGNVLQTGQTLKGVNELFPELGADVQNQTTPQNFSVTSYVRLPNGKQYNFKYNSYGDIARIELPTGGAIEYDWNGVAVPGCGARVKRWVTERRVYPNGGTGTGYESKTKYPRGNNGLLTVYDGNNTPLSSSKHYFTAEEPGCSYGSLSYQRPTGQFGREYKIEVYSADGTALLRKTETEFEFRNMTTIYGNVQVDYRPTRITTTLADVSPNLVSKVEFGYDPSADVSRQTDVWEYDYGNNQAGLFKRRTHTDYISTNPVNNINYLDNNIRLVNLTSQTWVSSDLAGANKLSLTKYEYDNYASDSQHAPLVARDDIIGHLRTDNTNSFNTSYTTRGNLTKVTRYINALNESAGSVSGASQYDIAGNIVKIIDAKENASTINYNDNFGSADNEARTNNPSNLPLNGKQTYAFATSSSNPLQFISYAQFDYYTSLPVNSEDVNGVISKRIYNDLLDRTTQSVVAVGTALEQQSTVSYDDTNRIVTGTSDFNSLGDHQLKTESLYDGLGRTFESRRYQSDGTFIATRKEFDALGRAYKTTNPFKQGISENNLRWTKREFDDLSRVNKVILSDDTPSTNADNATVISEYLGNTTTITDQSGKKRKGISNALGQMVQVVEDPTGQNLTTDYVFDAMGNLHKTVQGVQSRYFFYDSLGRVIRVRQPEQGTNASLNLTDSLTGNSQWSVGYTYDSNGNIITTTDSRNITITGTYDNLNRLTLRDYSDPSTPDISFIYDMTNIQGTSSNYKGGLTKVITGDPFNPFSVSYNLSVDILGRVKSSQQTTDGNVYNFPNYSYNLVGALTSQTYPSGKVVNNEYQTGGELSRVTGQVNINSGSKLYASAFSYTEAGAVKSMRLGNGKWETAQFNSRLQITQIGLGVNETDTSLLKLELSYGTNDQNNRNLKEQKISFAGLAQPIVQTYSYDSLNRLQSATETNQGNSTVIWKETFNYDRYGNRSFDELNSTSITLGCTVTSQNPNGVCNKEIVNPQVNLSTNRFANGQIYEYDSAGNLIKDAEGKQFAYDADNRQRSFGINGSNTNGGQYLYDGLGKRVKTIVPLSMGGEIATIFVYDTFGKMVAEYENTPPVSNPKTKYLTADHLGTPRIITDGLGEIISRHDYRAFGEEIIAGTGSRTVNQKYSSPDAIRQQYTGYQRDVESGLDYAQARYYNNRHGRFTSVDPLVASATTKNPQTFNRYSYALNNPYKYTDPTGLYSECAARPDICENTTRVRGNAERERGIGQFRDKKGGNPTGPTKPFPVFAPTNIDPLNEDPNGIVNYIVNVKIDRHSETDDDGKTWIANTTRAQFRAYVTDKQPPHRGWTSTYRPYFYEVEGTYEFVDENGSVVGSGIIGSAGVLNIPETGEINIADIDLDFGTQLLYPGDTEAVYEPDPDESKLTVIVTGKIIFHSGTTQESWSSFKGSASINNGSAIKETGRQIQGGPIQHFP